MCEKVWFTVCKPGNARIMGDFVIQLRDWKVLPVIYSLTATSRNEPVRGSVYCPFSFIPTPELLTATAHRYDFIFLIKCNAFSCLHEKHFSTFIKTKCNSFSFIHLNDFLQNRLNQILHFPPEKAAQIYPPEQNKSKLNVRPHQQCPFFCYEPFH